jgi:hypothetical protein
VSRPDELSSAVARDARHRTRTATIRCRTAGLCCAVIVASCTTPPAPAALDAGAQDAARDAAVQDAATVDAAEPERCRRVVGNTHARNDDELEALREVHTVTGTLSISGGTDLSALGCLRRVDGDLVLEGAAQLQSLVGLSALEEVGGEVRIVVCPGLLEVELPVLRAIEGGLAIDGNRALTAISGLSRLERVGGALRVSDSPRLRAIVGLEALETLGGLELLNLPALEEVRDLDRLTRLDGALRLELTRTATLAGLAMLEHITGALELRELDGTLRLPALARVDGVLSVGGDRLTAVELPALASLGALRFDFGSVRTLVLPALRTVGGDLDVRDAPLLDALELPALEVVSGTVTLTRNRSLAVIGLDRLTSARALSLTANPGQPALRASRLTELFGPCTLSELDVRALELTGLTRTKTLYLARSRAPTALHLDALTRTDLVVIDDVAGLELLSLPSLRASYDLAVTRNAALTTLRVPVLAEATGRLSFRDNPRLTALELSSLAGTAITLDVRGHAGLRTISAPRLTRLGSLLVDTNTTLEQLWLPDLSRVDQSFGVTDNPALSTCAVEALRDQVTAAGGIGGALSISGNAACR